MIVTLREKSAEITALKLKAGCSNIFEFSTWLMLPVELGISQEQITVQTPQGKLTVPVGSFMVMSKYSTGTAYAVRTQAELTDLYEEGYYAIPPTGFPPKPKP